MLEEAKELIARFPELYQSFDDPKEEPDFIRGYDANSLMGIYLVRSTHQSSKESSMVHLSARK